ncbi:MAG: NAD(P)-dependent oxidoreductase [Patescibacteria group bacterium]
MSYKILNTIGKKYSKEARKILKRIGRIDYLELNQEELKNKISQYDILIVGLGLNINKEIIKNGKNLKIIAATTTGLDHIDINFAKTKNIKILSLKGQKEFLKNVTSTAELAFGLIIILLRNIFSAFESVKKYHWQREKFRGFSLRGETLGIVGLGRLGKIMAKYANTFGMKVIAYDPSLKNYIFDKFGCKKVNFHNLLAKSDIITIHVPLDKKTKNMFDRKAFDKMKTTALLINTSRGKIVNEKDLLKSLRKNKIAGYGTDVLADELNFTEKFDIHPLVEYAKNNNNLIILPHIGGMTHQSREMTDIFMAEKIKKELSK